ncbi:Heptosyltransferase [Acetobacteraceae bacterium AT-5844]|nr:Heptosyltransferase [Acetobacteraceae bacterium AT-5844]
MSERILVIKLSALGDVIQAFGPFAAIRAHHPRARITLLTTRPFAPLLRRSPWFDEVWEDGRPSWGDLPAVARLALRLRRGRFDRVYDLQTSSRSSRYRWFTGPVEWSGVESHRSANPRRDSLHTIERQREQLQVAGLVEFPEPVMDWLDEPLDGFALPPRFCLLIPGASPTRPLKRWPAARFAELATRLPAPPVVLGGPSEAPLAAEILQAVPQGLDLTGRTSLAQIGALARRAECAIGNDTGPTHLVAAAGCLTLAVFGEDSDPALSAPRGPRAGWVRHVPLAELPVAQVEASLASLRKSRARQG